MSEKRGRPTALSVERRSSHDCCTGKFHQSKTREIVITKKLLTIAVICAATASSSFADTWVSVGSAPSAEGGGTSLAFATKGANSNFGFGLGFVFNSEFGNKDLLDYPVPHSSYKNLGTKRTGNSVGLDGYYFFGDSTKIRPYVGLGIYNSPRKEIAQSTVTGWYYTQSTQSAVAVSGELGLQYVSDGGLTLGLGFNSIRGASLSIGSAF